MVVVGGWVVLKVNFVIGFGLGQAKKRRHQLLVCEQFRTDMEKYHMVPQAKDLDPSSSLISTAFKAALTKIPFKVYFLIGPSGVPLY